MHASLNICTSEMYEKENCVDVLCNNFVLKCYWMHEKILLVSMI